MSTEFEQVIGAFQSLIIDAQTWRYKRPEWDTRDGETAPEWVWFERDTMLRSVNIERKSRGLRLATMADIVRLETEASGHSDYTRQLAVGCARLGMGMGEGQ